MKPEEIRAAARASIARSRHERAAREEEARRKDEAARYALLNKQRELDEMRKLSSLLSQGDREEYLRHAVGIMFHQLVTAYCKECEPLLTKLQDHIIENMGAELPMYPDLNVGMDTMTAKYTTIEGKIPELRVRHRVAMI